jgi:hypothetical protein
MDGQSQIERSAAVVLGVEARAQLIKIPAR